MLRFVDDHPEIDYVIIYMRSRVFRNHTDAAITKRALLEKGVRLISAKEEFGEGYMADAMEAITDIMNEVQVRQSGEDIKVKMLHKAKNGGTTGRAKLGYLNVRKNFDGRLVNTIDIDPDRAQLIQWAFEAYASGEYTLIELQSALADQGLTTRKTARLRSQPVSVSQLSVILHDPYYTGVISYKGELYPGRHEPLITKELFLRVQDVLNERARRGQRDIVHHHWLKGLLYCQHCHVQGRRSRLVFSQNRGNGGIYYYFICTGRQQGLCNLPSLPASEIEAQVARQFALLELPHDFVEKIRSDIEAALGDVQELDRRTRANFAKEIHKLDVREEHLLDLASDGELVTSKLKERLRNIKLQRDVLKEKLERTDAQIARGAAAMLIYLEMLAHPGKLYRESTDNARRQLLEAFYVELRVSEDTEVDASAREPVQELRDAAAAMRLAAIEKVGPQKHKNPSLSAGAYALLSSVGLLSEIFQSHGVSKTTLVAGTGFEPATSGL
jgi:site-specific DNA recombinase